MTGEQKGESRSKRGRKPGPEGTRGEGIRVRLTDSERAVFAAAASAAGDDGIASWMRRVARRAAGLDEL